MKKFLLFLILFIPFDVFSQTSNEQVKIEEIKSQIEKYYWGEAIGFNESSVLSDAQKQLSRTICSKIVYNSKSIIENDNENYHEDLMIISTVKLNDLNKIIYEINNERGERQVAAFVYVSKEKFQRDYEHEKNRIKERVFTLINEGKLQEEKLNIADALRYFNWAINLSRFYKIYDSISDTDNRPLDLWLDDKIKSILANIEVSIDEKNIKIIDNHYDKYNINLRFTYVNRPISLVEFRYFTGETNIQVGVKNGEAVVKYPSLNGINEIKLNILYAYDGENDLDDEMLAVYKSQSRKTYDNINIKRIPIKIKNQEIKTLKQDISKDELSMWDEIHSKEVGSIAPNVKNLRNEVDREFLTEVTEIEKYRNVVESIKMAITNGEYDNIQHLFNKDAYNQFLRMVKIGNLSLSKSSTLNFERSQQYIRCGKIPVNVKTGNKIRNENIIIRFDLDSIKVSSISYALTENAENDIFRESKWSLNARYSLLKFMEDYQTAYALRDIQFLEQIFQDNAIIIVGNTISTNKNKKFNCELPWQLKFNDVGGVRYTTFDKKSYIDHLKEIFQKNDYVYLTFHDAVISKASTPDGMPEAYLIELKQDHNSTKYNDKGYLTLQIGMLDNGSSIFVRTWTPYFVSLDEMKERYPFSYEIK